MTYTVYVLKSLKDAKRYVGYTKDLDRRLLEHENGGCKSTRNRKPFKLVYAENFQTKSEAMGRERFFKSSKGRGYLKALNL